MTPHLEFKKEDISNIVLMPGDPLRAKYISDNYLENSIEINDVRNMLGYTGYYKGKKITVIGSGMGNPSMGIYSYELYKFYDVDYIIRIGTCGAYKDLKLMDVILVDNSCSESTYAKVLDDYNLDIVKSSDYLNKLIEEKAKENDINILRGNIHCSDVFYKETNNTELIDKYNCLGVEMETFALFSNARLLNKNASAIITVSDSINHDLVLSQEEREKSLNMMIILALESILNIGE
ncbi:MAG: purine-nucleoside phosphorylase [Bacilli bacterium]|nr:purine-nucleoside phosphorylase [Bacilli bacterium]